MQFMVDTSGLNSYAHAFMMPSGKMFVQANISAMLWDPATFGETRLPDVPGGVVRVYPASGGVAMLPLTPANNYNPTLLFCGGSDMPEYDWGNYSWPFVDTWLVPASKDCQRITPEPLDGSSPVWEQDDDLLESRTMGQLIALPTVLSLSLTVVSMVPLDMPKGLSPPPPTARCPLACPWLLDPLDAPAFTIPPLPRAPDGARKVCQPRTSPVCTTPPLSFSLMVRS
jgi:hypothetical protein